MKRWCVCNMPDDVIAAIKNRAIEYGCSIPEVLADAFGREAPVDRTRVWKLYNVPMEVKKQVITMAMKSKQPIEMVLKRLLNKQDASKIEKQLRLSIAKEVREDLKKFVRRKEFS